MKLPMSLRTLLSVAALLLAGCGGGGGSGGAVQSPNGGTPPTPTPVPPAPAPVEINGAVQKGPFLVGSTVLVNLLDERGRSTPSTIVSKIEDSIGSFSFVASQTGPAQLVASGYYFSELTGQVSAGPITLRAVYGISDEQGQVAYVNILTHLINDRVLKLFSAGNVTLANAIAQAESELLAAFASAVPAPDIGTFSELNIYATGGASNIGDAYLLALSTAFYKYASDKAQQFGTATDAELTLILNQLSEDLEGDGRLQAGTFLKDFIRAVRMLNPEAIISNLRNRSIVDYPQGLDVPDISVFLSLCAGDLECPWRAGAPVPGPGGVAVAYAGKVYLFGPQFPIPNSFEMRSRDSYEYDPTRNEWRQLASVPADNAFVAGVIGDKIYVVVAYSRDLFEYTPSADQWRKLAPRPTDTNYAFTGAVFDGKLYVIGGDIYSPTGPIFSDSVDIYDPVTNSWSPGRPAPMGVSIWSDNACVYGGEIYIFGGTLVVGARPETFVWSYDPVRDSWSAKTPMTASRERFACAVVGDEIFVLGGEGADRKPIDVVERFHALQQTWSSPTRLPTGRPEANAVAIGNRILVVGGWVGSTQTDYVEILDTEAL